MYARRFCLLLLVASLCLGTCAFADSVTFTGTLYSTYVGTDSTGSTDPMFSDLNALNSTTPLPSFSLELTFDPSQYTNGGNPDSYFLTNATLTGWFGSAANAISYSSDATTNNTLEFANPGPYPGGVSFQFCTSDCTGDFINLYFTGTITSPGMLATEANTLTGDPNARPQFEFLRALDSGDQTDLIGTLDSPTGNTGAPVTQTPEPATLTLLASGLGAAWLRSRKR